MPSLTYETAGVNVAHGESAVRKITPGVKTTLSPQVLPALGGYAGLYRLLTKRIKDPVLVASTDGVGTKLAVATLMDRHRTIGIDLVAMSVNDVIVSGATPLFFLDYFACGVLSASKLVEVVKGIVKGCRMAGCALIGGETAEMPGFYPNGQYDLAGFAVGVVEHKKRIDGKDIRPGDLLIGLASSGLHSNGYALARKIVFEKMGLNAHDPLPGFKKSVGDLLLTPTTIYAACFLKTAQKVTIKGAAHITGGGMTRNIPRILPDHCAARVHNPTVPKIFKILEKEGGIDRAEMYRTFNMGVGMVVIVAPEKASRTVSLLTALGQKAFILGEVIRKRQGERVIYV